ncbi:MULTISPECIES: hypothetical protein [Burkholderia]|uniref:hypothetical protein n=1 Tax=Burkholderia TaxID=32008 RepID=UPI000DACB2C7|nr:MULTISPECIES: hypothetical protein [Burkholderia]MDP9548436.1 hypothetical protein [Burkholderia cepacia]DAH98969.1 MAG TPA: hypothetical protein [Caudoviricetes sp.]MBR8392548.1 hypothetical protein [Burkholderia cenocepacia]MBR8469390.1 hypothetical protein [Burkholderia cenocepacia]MBR8488606.1 hypothetical protein [Burkholderia cenocepacia]
MKSKILAPFASFLSNAPRAAGARIEEGGGDDDERKQREGESDEDYAKRMEDLDEKERAEQEEKEKEAAARRAEEEREREEAEQRAAAEGDDDSEDDDGDDATASAARQRERVRCARIMAHGIKLGRARQAGVFAFDTKMSSRAAIAALNAGAEDAPAQPRRASSLSSRMASTSIPSAGAGGVTPKAPTLAEQIVQAGKKRRGEA